MAQNATCAEYSIQSRSPNLPTARIAPSYQAAPSARRTFNSVDCSSGPTRTAGRINYNILNGYAIVCFIASLMAILAILLLHALSSIWLDPRRNATLNEDFVYMTIAMAAASLALNLCAVATYGIQIYLVSSDFNTEEYRKTDYLKQVATIRFVATFCSFGSIPVYMISFCCYIFMEFRFVAAITAMSIIGAALIFILFGFCYSWRKWDRFRNTILGKDKFQAVGKKTTDQYDSNLKEAYRYWRSPQVQENTFALSDIRHIRKNSSTGNHLQLYRCETVGRSETKLRKTIPVACCSTHSDSHAESSSKRPPTASPIATAKQDSNVFSIDKISGDSFDDSVSTLV